MALTTKRIIALPSQTDPQEGDYLAIDNLQGGTHKIPVGRVGVEVDDTLTEAGKAADAKAVGDALGEIRSQAEATDDAIDELRSQIEVTGTASGAIATFTDGADMPAKSVIVNIVPKQSGSGTPSPENVRPIAGWTSVTVYVSPTEDEADATTTTVNLGRTVYGGTLDVVSGVLTSYPFYPSYNGETLDGRWICDRAVYAEGATPPTGSQVALISGTGTTYQLTPTEIQTLLGENNVWADSGDVEITYRRDISIVINNLESALNG